jgi:sugar phosphate isomerase/epimerase
MTGIDRRVFLGGVASLAGVYLGAAAPRMASDRKRKFTMDLVCGMIGVRANQREAIRLARQGGFESVQPVAGELARMSSSELSELLQLLDENQLVWGAAGLPVDFRKDAATFQAGLARLPELAAALQRAGATRVSTWLSPMHDDLTYVSNFKQHATRLREVAKVLADHDQRFGLEYVGPKTLWSSRRYPFIHSMAETKELIAEIGKNNVGFVLDSWHWYTAGETQQDLLTLSNEDVVACDLNDAPAGIPVDQQIDNRRELPSATGVIDVASFLKALITVGYNGPVRAEPFNQKLREMDNEDAIAATATAMRQAFALVEDG